MLCLFTDNPCPTHDCIILISSRNVWKIHLLVAECVHSVKFELNTKDWKHKEITGWQGHKQLSKIIKTVKYLFKKTRDKT